MQNTNNQSYPFKSRCNPVLCPQSVNSQTNFKGYSKRKLIEEIEETKHMYTFDQANVRSFSLNSPKPLN